MVSLESPHRGDSNEHTQHTIFIIKKKIPLDYPKSAAMGFFLGTQERAISVRATEVLLYLNSRNAIFRDYRQEHVSTDLSCT